MLTLRKLKMIDNTLAYTNEYKKYCLKNVYIKIPTTLYKY